MDSVLLEKVVKSIQSDLEQTHPLFVNSVFTPNDLNLTLDLKLPYEELKNLFTVLEISNIVQVLDKSGANEDYYNIKNSFYNKYRKHKFDREYVEGLDDPKKGFCIINNKEYKVYRQRCMGRACKFYMDTDRKCILGKFFK